MERDDYIDEEDQPFDESTSFHDRSMSECWLPYSDPYQKALRDAIVGRCPGEHDQLFQPVARYLTRSQVQNAYDSVSFANYQGAIINVEITIAWHAMGYLFGQEIQAVYELYKQALRKHLNKKTKFYHYAVFEYCSKNGCHSHEGLHVPAQHLPKFKKWIKRYIARLNKTEYPVSQALNIDARSDYSVGSQWSWFKYCMKSLDPKLTEQERYFGTHTGGKTANDLYGVKREDTGLVFLERIRLSQDMLEKSRNIAGYTPGMYLYDNPDPDRYSDHEFERGKADRLTAELIKACG